MKTMTEPAFLYTFSTIAQALAGAIALLAAFVLFTLQSMDTERPQHATRVLEDFSDQHDPLHQPLRDHFASSRWGAFLETLPPDYTSRRGTSDEHRRAYQRLRERRKERTALVTKLQRAVRFTRVTLGLAVCALAFAPYVGSWEVSIIGAFVFATCLSVYWPVIAALWEGDEQ